MTLKREFESNEADIIHALYSDHFKTKAEAEREAAERMSKPIKLG